MKCETDRLTVGLASLRIGGGLLPHQLYRLIRRGLVPAEKIGRLNVIRVDDLPAIRAAATAAGYIRGEAAAATEN